MLQSNGGVEVHRGATMVTQAFENTMKFLSWSGCRRWVEERGREEMHETEVFLTFKDLEALSFLLRVARMEVLREKGEEGKLMRCTSLLGRPRRLEMLLPSSKHFSAGRFEEEIKRMKKKKIMIIKHKCK